MSELRYPGRSHPGTASGSYIDGASSHPLNSIYRAMINRCENPEDGKWADYGGRGIKVCQRWRESFWNYVEDVGERPPGEYPSGRARFEMDRIDNDGDYEPSNFRWATRSENLSNRRIHLAVRCPQGHDYADTGFTNSNGYRECLVCKRKRGAEWMRARRKSVREAVDAMD